MTTAEHQLCQTLAERQEALLAIIAASRSDLLIYAPRLDPRLMDSAATQTALQQFLLASPRHGVRIVVGDAAAMVRDCPRLTALARRLPSRCSLRIPAPEAEPLDEVAILSDRPHALHRPAGERIVHRYLNAAPQLVAPLRQRIEPLWEAGRASAEFRDLAI